jgi:hypothetical protein
MGACQRIWAGSGLNSGPRGSEHKLPRLGVASPTVEPSAKADIGPDEAEVRARGPGAKPIQTRISQGSPIRPSNPAQRVVPKGRIGPVALARLQFGFSPLRGGEGAPLARKALIAPLREIVGKATSPRCESATARSFGGCHRLNLGTEFAGRVR